MTVILDTFSGGATITLPYDMPVTDSGHSYALVVLAASEGTPTFVVTDDADTTVLTTCLTDDFDDACYTAPWESGQAGAVSLGDAIISNGGGNRLITYAMPAGTIISIDGAQDSLAILVQDLDTLAGSGSGNMQPGQSILSDSTDSFTGDWSDTTEPDYTGLEDGGLAIMSVGGMMGAVPNCAALPGCFSNPGWEAWGAPPATGGMTAGPESTLVVPTVQCPDTPCQGVGYPVLFIMWYYAVFEGGETPDPRRYPTQSQEQAPSSLVLTGWPHGEGACCPRTAAGVHVAHEFKLTNEGGS